MIRQLEISGRILKYDLTRKKVKNLNLRVHRDGNSISLKEAKNHKFRRISAIHDESMISKPKHFLPRSFSDAPI